MSVKSQWQELAHSIWHDRQDAIGPNQRIESERLFYSGYAACLAELTALTESPDDAAVDTLEKLTEEIRAFQATLKDPNA